MPDKGIDSSVFKEIGQKYFGFPGAGISQAATGEDFIFRIATMLLLFAAAIAVIFLVVGGYRYVVSRGNEESMEAAKKTITSSILGLVIIILAFAMVQIISNFLTEAPTVEKQTGTPGGPAPSGNEVNIRTTSTDFLPGQTKNFVALTADNCPAADCRWQASGAPAWISVSSAGVLSGTAPSVSIAQDQTFPFQVTARNTATSRSQTKTFTVTLKALEPGAPTP